MIPYRRTIDDRFAKTMDDRFARAKDDRFTRTIDDRYARTMDDRFTRTIDDLLLSSFIPHPSSFVPHPSSLVSHPSCLSSLVLHHSSLAESVCFLLHGIKHCKYVLIFFIQFYKDVLVDIIALQREFQPCLCFSCFLLCV